MASLTVREHFTGNHTVWALTRRLEGAARAACSAQRPPTLDLGDRCALTAFLLLRRGATAFAAPGTPCLRSPAVGCALGAARRRSRGSVRGKPFAGRLGRHPPRVPCALLRNAYRGYQRVSPRRRLAGAANCLPVRCATRDAWLPATLARSPPAASSDRLPARAAATQPPLRGEGCLARAAACSHGAEPSGHPVKLGSRCFKPYASVARAAHRLRTTFAEASPPAWL